MTADQLTELTDLLSRIKAAGGPVRISGGPEYTAVGGPWGETYDASNLDELFEAELIHALKLDARARGNNAYHSEPPQGTAYRLEDSRHIIRFAPAPNRSNALEVIAYCLAWLAAFESDQLVPNGAAE